MAGFELFGIVFVFLGLFIILLGVLFLFRRRSRSLGRLPGDVNVRKGNVRFYFPVVTTLLISLALTLILNLILWLVRC